MLAAPSVETIQWHIHGRNRASTYPAVFRFEGQSQPQLESRMPIGKQRACPEARVTPPQIPLFLKVARQKTTYFGEIGRFFPVVSRSNPRCSKAQIASYLARIRRFLAPIAWASSASTTKKISPQSTQAWFRKGSRRFWASFFGGNGWKRAVAVPDMLAAPSVETIQWHIHGRNRASTYPAVFRVEGQSQPQLESRRPIGK